MRDTGSAWVVADATGMDLAFVYYGDPRAVGTGFEQLTRDQARRIAANIAKIPGNKKGPEAEAPGP